MSAEEKQLFGAIRNTGIDFSSYNKLEVTVDGKGKLLHPSSPFKLIIPNYFKHFTFIILIILMIYR